MKRAKIPQSRPDWLVPLEDPRDEEILGAAFDVFGDKTFDGATMLEIATRAGVSKKTLYERFHDKAGLFRALIAWGCRQNLPDVAPPDDGDPARALERHGLTVLAAMMRAESLLLARIVIAEGGRFTEIGQAFDAMTRQASVAILDVLAERLVKARLCRIADKVQFGEDFVALLRGDAYFRVLNGAIPAPTAKAIAAQARHATKLVMAAYAPGKRS